MPRALPIAAALLLFLFALGGCGGGGGEAGKSSSSSSAAAGSEGSSLAEAQGSHSSPGDGSARQGGSPILGELRRQFTAPKPQPTVAGSAAAIKAGEEACAGKSPVEVKDAFYAKAVTEGSLDPQGEQARAIAQIAAAEANAGRDPSFVAGQLAADVYEATLPAPIARFGYEGCVHALARGLEAELAGGGTG